MPSTAFAIGKAGAAPAPGKPWGGWPPALSPKRSCTIIRAYFPPEQAGARIGLTLSATLLGIALGGWMSGAIYDLTLSYDLAFLNGFFWNLINLAIAVLLLFRLGRRTPLVLRTAP
jgi:predicted MFS family arabinose efflux permease